MIYKCDLFLVIDLVPLKMMGKWESVSEWNEAIFRSEAMLDVAEGEIHRDRERHSMSESAFRN
jgi:hypothetical protein